MDLTDPTGCASPLSEAAHDTEHILFACVLRLLRGTYNFQVYKFPKLKAPLLWKETLDIRSGLNSTLHADSGQPDTGRHPDPTLKPLGGIDTSRAVTRFRLVLW